MALVGQEPVLFDMTIRENLLWGCDNDDEEANDVPLEEIIAVASMANVHKYVPFTPSNLPLYHIINLFKVHLLSSRRLQYTRGR